MSKTVSETEKRLIILSELIAQHDLLMSDKAAQREKLIPLEVTQALNGLDLEYDDKEKTINTKIEEATALAKSAIIVYRKNVSAGGLLLVYIPPKPKINDMDSLMHYIADHDELGYLVSMSEPQMQLRWAAK